MTPSSHNVLGTFCIAVAIWVTQASFTPAHPDNSCQQTSSLGTEIASVSQSVPAEAHAFPRPAELEEAVSFWTDIFSRHTTTQVVLHDREDLGVIWGIEDLPVDQEGKVKEPDATNYIRDLVDDLRARMQHLSDGGKPADNKDLHLTTIAQSRGIDLNRVRKNVRGQRGIADRFADGLERSKLWLPKIQNILAAKNAPLELAALPFIESGFNPVARSSAGAAGLWQLMPGTARELGLRVSRRNDERLDVVKATAAAARMLMKNHKMLGNWPLAITGYNHGPYGLRRAVKSVGSSDLIYLIDNYKKRTWGFASKNFYAQFLAALSILKAYHGA